MRIRDSGLDRIRIRVKKFGSATMQFSAIVSLKDGEDLALLEEEEQQKELELGRGNRARKEVAYQEQLSERDWLKVSRNGCS
jgi:hypothetical protein